MSDTENRTSYEVEIYETATGKRVGSAGVRGDTDAAAIADFERMDPADYTDGRQFGVLTRTDWRKVSYHMDTDGRTGWFEQGLTSELRGHRPKTVVFDATEGMTDEEEDVYGMLDEMIDKLYDAGVDTSYFPEDARKVLATYARKIAGRESG